MERQRYKSRTKAKQKKRKHLEELEKRQQIVHARTELELIRRKLAFFEESLSEELEITYPGSLPATVRQPMLETQEESVPAARVIASPASMEASHAQKMIKKSTSSNDPYPGSELKPREDPNSWKTEVVEDQLFIPVNSGLIGANVDTLMSKYHIRMEAPESAVLRGGDVLILEGESEKVDKFVYDLFHAR